jgi:hypothetical protein
MDMKTKILKILEKAQSTTHDAEADALFSKARTMMEEHQISAFDLQAGADPIGQRRTNAFQKNTPASLRYWMEGEVAQFYGCTPVTLTWGAKAQRIGTKAKQVIELIGPESALVTTELMFPFIWKQILEKARTYAKGDAKIERKIRKEICDAFALRLHWITYRAKKAEASTPSTEGGRNALVVIGTALEAYVQNRYPDLKTAPAWEPKTSDIARLLAQGISIDHQMGHRVDRSHRLEAR